MATSVRTAYTMVVATPSRGPQPPMCVGTTVASSTISGMVEAITPSTRTTALSARCWRANWPIRRVGEAGGHDDVHRAHSVRSYVAQAMCDSRSVTAIPARPLADSPKAPAWTRATRRSATTRASSSVVVFMLANSGSSSRLR